MAVVQVIENGGARLEVSAVSRTAAVTLTGEVSQLSIDLDAEDLKALIKRCRTVLAEIEG
jgi:hypothetical protein